MAVASASKYSGLHERLAHESNSCVKTFDVRLYSKISDIDDMLLKRDISVMEKKRILMRELHSLVVRTFSVDRKRLGRKAFESFKKRIHAIRKIIVKLRGINYYLETTFLEELKVPEAGAGSNMKASRALARDEVEALEYIAYRLIEEAVVLDKRLLGEYASRGKKVMAEEKAEAKSLGLLLRKESELMEHLEAKLPPPGAVSFSLVKEPVFTHWVARVFALLSYLEHVYGRESEIFSQLGKNKLLKAKINRKITQLMKERAELLRVMEEKSTSMGRLMASSRLKKELHRLTTTLAL